MATSTGLTLTGKVIKVGEELKISDTFTKRELWMEIDRDSQYPQTVQVEFVKDKTALLNPVGEGDLVSVDVNIRGQVREVKGVDRCFTSLNGWRLKVDQSNGKASNNGSSMPSNDAVPSEKNEDDLPF